MKSSLKVAVLFSLLISFPMTPTLFAGGVFGKLKAPAKKEAKQAKPCTICHEEESIEGASHQLLCSEGHLVHGECLADQLNHTDITSEKQAKEIREKGIPCMGESCQGSLDLKAVTECLGKQHDAVVGLNKRLEGATSTCNSTPAATPARPKTPEEEQERQVRELQNHMQEAFNLCCPGSSCTGTLAPIEGCNAATCAACQSKFCYLCLQKGADSQEGHAHVQKHSDDFWERRDAHTGQVPAAGEAYSEVEEYEVTVTNPQTGKKEKVKKQRPYKYTDRYHWLIARDKLEGLLRAEKSQALQSAAITGLKPLLKGNKMWPMPVSKDTEHWTQEVMKNSKLDQRNKIALLQNEFIYQNKIATEGKTPEAKEEASHNKDIIQAVLTSLQAPVLASLDTKDAPKPPRPQNNNISPVLEGEADFAHVPEGMRNMGRENIYRIHDPLEDPARRVPDFILSHVAPNDMTHEQAIAYCRDRGARLPTKEEYEALGRAMGRGQPGGYQANLIPEMNGRWFWSGSVRPNGADSAFYFNGGNGYVLYGFRDNSYSVRCLAGAQRG